MCQTNSYRNILAMRYASVFATTLLLSGCTTTPPPTQEMSDARQSIEAAENVGANSVAPTQMNNAQKFLTKAQNGIREGNFNQAQRDAVAAKSAAENAIRKSENKKEAPYISDFQPRSNINETNSINSLNASASRYHHYLVLPGDNLSSIAAKTNIYQNQSYWPLIFDLNQSQITDADLIYPGQVFTINLSIQQSKKFRAKQHALQRGHWQLGVRENSDSIYLMQENSSQ